MSDKYKYTGFFNLSTFDLDGLVTFDLDGLVTFDLDGLMNVLVYLLLIMLNCRPDSTSLCSSIIALQRLV